MTDPYSPHKQDYKAGLIMKLGLAAAVAYSGRVHMVRASQRPGQPHRLLCHDGSWVEIDRGGRMIRTWGEGGTAREIATAIMADDEAYQVEHLEKTATAAAPGAPRRAAPVLPDDKLKALADGWRQRGFADVEMDDSGVWVALPGGSRLYDSGTRVTIHGRITNEALAAMVAKAKSDWNGQHRLHGTWTDHDRESMWLESQRQGVTLLDYEPSPALIARWEAERDAAGSSTAQALRPDTASGPAAAGPVPPMGGDSSAEVEPKASPVPLPGADDALARHVHRAQIDLDALHSRWSREARSEADRDRLRKEEAVLKAKLAIYERARVLAHAEGLSREDAIRAAYAEAQEREHEPVAALRR
ncbi:hypothetical protein [Devosia sp. A369]